MKIACCASEDINLGFGYVIQHLKNQGHEVKLFFDPRQFDRGYARNNKLANLLSIETWLLEEIKKFKPDMALFSCVTANYQWALKFSKQVKQWCDCKIVFGGVHPTLVPEEVKKNNWIDDIAVGSGIEYFGGIFNPDELFPDREIFLKELPPEHRKIQLFMTSIGCPFNCSYCGNEQLRKVGQFKYIQRSVDGCIRELKQLKERGAKYILFVDDVLTAKKEWFKEFIENYRYQINLPFSCFVHPKLLDEERVKLLKEGGCQSAWMGIQTGYEPLRRDILNRQETNKEVIDTCLMIKNAGIKLIVDHIFGIPYESEMSNDLSHALYDHIKPDIVNCYELLYFPKAGIIQHGLSCGYLTPLDVEKINRGEGIVYQTNNKGQHFYDMYAKGFHAIPLGGIMWEFLPLSLIKIIVLFRAGRGFTIRACLQNEIFFTYRAFLKKAGLWNGRK